MYSVSPLISVIIPVYNGSNFIARAIESVLNQTYKRIEIIVVNDGSDDNGKTENIVKSFGKKIRYIKKINGGVASALNVGIANMSGDFFSWLSHDDEYDPSYLETVVKTLQGVPAGTVIGSGYKLIDERSIPFHTYDPTKDFDSHKLGCGLYMLLRGKIHGCALVIPKLYFREVGLFNEELPTTQDYDFFYRLFKKAPLSFLSSPLVRVRSHKGQGCRTHLSQHIQECDKLWIWMLSNLKASDVNLKVEDFPLFLKGTFEFLRDNTGYIDCKRFAKLFYLKSLLANGSIKKFHSECYSLLGWNLQDCVDFDLTNYHDDRPKVMFYLMQHAPTSGLNKIVLKLAESLKNQYSVFVTFQLSDKKYVNKNLPVVFLPWSREAAKFDEKLTDLAYLLGINILINSYNCSARDLNIFDSAKVLSIKTIAWNHEHYFTPFFNKELIPQVIDRNEKLKKADRVVWLNKKSLNIYSLHANNGVVIPNGLSSMSSVVAHKQNRNILLAVGRFNDFRKRLDLILKVFSDAKKRIEQLRLIVVGPYDLNLSVYPGNSQTYKDLIEDLGLPAESIEFVGEKLQLDEYYAQASLLLHCAENEGFGLVIGEAAHYSTPTVMFAQGGSEELIENGVNGLVYPAGAYEEMALGITNLLRDEEKLKEMQRECQSILQNFSMDRFIKNWQELIDELTIKKSPKICETKNIPLREMQEASSCYEKSFFLLYKNQVNEYELNRKATEREKELEKQLSTLLQSRSWKLTRPLRKIADFLRSLR